jgi:SAM-dependent methyltransferase
MKLFLFFIILWGFSIDTFGASATKEGDSLRRRSPVSRTAVSAEASRPKEDVRSVYDESGCCGQCSRKSQDCCYQILANTCWGCIISQFEPGRIQAMNLLDLREGEQALFVGEGAGHDFAHLPEGIDLGRVHAFDFSSEMVKHAKIKAREVGIPEDNVFKGDAQRLPFEERRFDKIFFPLSLASIPNPQIAIAEAERVLNPGGRIVVFEKLLDEGVEVSCGKWFCNLFTSCIFADVTRNLPEMIGETPLKIMDYRSVRDLRGCASCFEGSYRLAMLGRSEDHPDLVSKRAVLEEE